MDSKQQAPSGYPREHFKPSRWKPKKHESCRRHLSMIRDNKPMIDWHLSKMPSPFINPDN